MPKQRGGGSVISFNFAPCAKAGSINFQLSLGVGHPILLRKHAHILSIKKSNLKLLFSKFC